MVAIAVTPGRESYRRCQRWGAEGATSPESLRPTDRPGVATLERSRFAGSPKGKFIPVVDDTSSTTRAEKALRQP